MADRVAKGFFGVQGLVCQGAKLEDVILDTADRFEQLFRSAPEMCYVRVREAAEVEAVGEIPGLPVVMVERDLVMNHVWVGQKPRKDV